MGNKMIVLLSWDSYGEMCLLIREKEYKYQNVTIELYFKIKALIKYKNWGAIFSILKVLSKEQE